MKAFLPRYLQNLLHPVDIQMPRFYYLPVFCNGLIFFLRIVENRPDTI